MQTSFHSVLPQPGSNLHTHAHTSIHRAPTHTHIKILEKAFPLQGDTQATDVEVGACKKTERQSSGVNDIFLRSAD